MKENLNISVCGLTCNSCPLLKLPWDENSGKEVLEWFQSEGWYREDQTISDIIETKDYCKGCRSDRKVIHWASNCSLLVCCVDKNQLNNCSECGDFPCDEYKKWVEQGTHHKKAYENLILIKRGKEPYIIRF